MPDKKITDLDPIVTVQPTTVLVVVDDPTGTPTNKKASVSQLQGALAALAPIVQTTTLTGTTDIALTPGCTLLRCNNASLLTITGLSGGVVGQRVTVESIAAGEVDLVHQNASTVAGNRLYNFAMSGSSPLAPGRGSATYVLDQASGWVCLQHLQGAFISVPFNAADFAAGGVTWTVTAAQCLSWEYLITNKLMTMNVVITGSTLSAPTTGTTVRLPRGMSMRTSGLFASVGRFYTAASTWAPLLATAYGAGATPTQLSLAALDGQTNMNATAAACHVQGQITFELL